MFTSLDIPTRDLPLWMRQARRGVDWGVLLVIVFSLTAAWSFIAQPGLPRTNATENYVFRAADTADALHEGRLYPRWSPHVFGGYGAPIPHYYPPGAAYSAALLQVLFTDDTVKAVRLVYIIAFCLAGAMTYVFVTRWVGAGAGVLASALYVYSPYVGLTAPFVLGDLPGMIGLALTPMLLWAVSRLLQLNRPPDLFLVASTTAGLLLTEVRAAVIGFMLAGLLVGWYGWTTQSVSRPRLVGIGFLLGAGMAALYWLPAFLEQDLVQWRAPMVVRLPLKLQFPALLLPLHQVDLAELFPTPQLTLGTAGVAYAAMGLLSILLVRRCTGFQGLFLVAGFTLLGATVTFFPGEIEVLGAVMLCLSVGSSAALRLYELLPVQSLVNLRNDWKRYAQTGATGTRLGYRMLKFAIHPGAWRRLVLALMVASVLATSLPVWLSPLGGDAFGDLSPNAQISYEQQGYGIAVLPPGAPIPATIPDSLLPDRILLSGYQLDNINKVRLDQISTGSQVSVLGHNTHSDRFQIGFDRPTTLDVLTAYFPGWSATLNGTPLTLRRHERTGLIRVTVPETQNGELEIRLESTPVRTLAWGISWASLLLLLLLTGLRFRQRDSHYDELTLLSVGEARLLGLVLSCFVTLVLWTATSPTQLRARPGYALDHLFSVESRTETGLEALAYRLDRTHYVPGETLDFSIYWRALRFLSQNYRVQVYLYSRAQGVAWLRTDLRSPGGYPTRRWLTNRYVTDPYSLSLPSSILPGEYQIAIEIYVCMATCSPDQRLTFFGKTGSEIGQVLLLPTVITIEP